MIKDFKLLLLLLMGMFLAVGVSSCGDDDDDPLAGIPRTNTEQNQSESSQNSDERTAAQDSEDKDATEQEEQTKYEAVDLGLSVKWATCNVGATQPYEYGDYFAWGETTPKENYDWSTYKYCNGSYNTQTKYNTSSYYGTVVDNKTVLDPEDDAATANWGGEWRMPTLSEQQELLNNCTWTWQTAGNDKYNGVAGYEVTGTNGKSIFLPAAGFRYGATLSGAGSYGNYWSATLYADDAGSAYGLYFYSDFQAGAATTAVTSAVQCARFARCQNSSLNVCPHHPHHGKA